MSYSSWYDRRNPSVAQWDKPSALIQIILLGCGGLSISISIMFFFLTYRLVQQEKLQKQFEIKPVIVKQITDLISISSTKNSNDTMNRKAMVQLFESKYQKYF